MGRFIVIEGLDGTGKTTQIKNLAAYLEKKGEKVHITAEPTAGETGKLCRRVLSGELSASPWASAALFLADRIQHNTEPASGIRKLLQDGFTVISDRYYYSTFAYQGFETELSWILNAHYNCPLITKPDLVLFLTMPVERCLERINANRAAEEIEIYENSAALTKISRQFDFVFEKIKDRENIVYIDADGSIEQVAERICSAVEESL